jgi:hypothetical protein
MRIHDVDRHLHSVKGKTMLSRDQACRDEYAGPCVPPLANEMRFETV